jgi:hypothetical protein
MFDPSGRGTDQRYTTRRRIRTFGKISGQTAEALLPEEKNAEYRALGAEGLGTLAFLHATCQYPIILSARADQGLQAAENETTALTAIKELQAIAQARGV